MTPSDSRSEVERLLHALRALLALSTMLLALMVVALGVGGWLAWERLAASEARLLAQAEAWQGATGRLITEATRRQAGLSTGLAAESQATEARLQALAARRRTLGQHPPNPLAKLDQVINLNALIADELLLLVRHTARMQEHVGEGLKPLSAQEGLTRPGSAP